MLIRQDFLPNKWDKVDLDNVVDFLDSQRKPITQKDRVQGKYPYYGANGQQDSINDYIFDEPLVLLAEDGGHFGNPEKTIAYQIEGKCWVNNHAHVLRPKNNIDIRYLCRYLERFDVVPFITGSTRGKLTKSAASKIPVPLPPIAEQRRIAAILDKADGIRRKRQEAIRLTEELGRSLFLDMFGDPVTNPKGWEVNNLGNVGNLERGKSKHRPRNDPSLLGGKYPLIQTGDVANCKSIIQKYSQTYSEKGLAQSRLWKAGTLCITIAANIAETGILSFDACFPDSIVGFSPSAKMNTNFVQGWFYFFQPILEASAPQSAQKNINLAILRDLKIIVPPVEKQEHFSKIIENLRKQSEKLEAHLKESENLFNSLLQRAFRGEL
ncbi:restriction endonuclease subunit S [Spirulina subsalsa FACHB-351]|uniref:Restriction endonuclease subunit S n=1 Tax=Spirulina subsalsa FACHB-351 TaxID=234711 RepID=A0ABT3L7M0_9CYAN|nr:restriction endonuclease subunit S [Spirulina subsalsa]MCW6037511.1 restriction endonuclease subunit S [Spirulina subsalsa FACHB-351]